MIRSSVASLILLVAATTIARADWSLTTADGPEQTHLTVNTWDAGEGISVSTQSGNLVKVESRNVIALTSDHKAAPSMGAWRLTLRNGDVLFGQPAGISGQSLTFTLPELGTIGVPLKLLLSLTSPKSTGVVTAVEANPDKDAVHLKNGDTMEGILAEVAADKLQLATGAETGNATATDIALGLVDHIHFAGVSPPRAIPPLSARITFLSGTTLTVPLDPKSSAFAWSISDLTLADPVGEKHKVRADQVLAVEVLGGRVVSLTQLDAADDQQTSFMGTHWPTRINKSVVDRPLTVAKTVYPQGLGVHTRSRIAYDLDGSFETFKIRVAMDDSAEPRGEADVSILLDGKVLWQKANLRASDSALSQELSLPVKGGKHLELHADPPQNRGSLDILGRVDWINPMLLRP